MNAVVLRPLRGRSVSLPLNDGCACVFYRELWRKQHHVTLRPGQQRGPCSFHLYNWKACSHSPEPPWGHHAGKTTEKLPAANRTNWNQTVERRSHLGTGSFQPHLIPSPMINITSSNLSHSWSPCRHDRTEKVSLCAFQIPDPQTPWAQ